MAEQKPEEKEAGIEEFTIPVTVKVKATSREVAEGFVRIWWAAIDEDPDITTGPIVSMDPVEIVHGDLEG